MTDEIPMVNPGGNLTMLGQWRIVIKQAEDAAKAGRFDEALALVTRPDVADHRLSIQLRNRLAQDLVGRGTRRAEADDTVGAIGDLDLAEKHGAAPDLLAAARMKVAERVAEDVKAELDAGDPVKVADRVAKLAEHNVSGPMLRRMREAAEAWKKALEDGRRGEFGSALEGLERTGRLAAGLATEALAAARRDLDGRRELASPRIERLYKALGSSHWGETLAAAEAVLETIPDHPAARQARAKAWQQIGALSPSASLPGRSERAVAPVTAAPRPVAVNPNAKPGIVFLDSADKPTEAQTLPWRDALLHRPGHQAPAPRLRIRDVDGPRGRFLLWADVIGGYLVCLDDEVILGRAGADSPADVPLLGDLSRQHATIIRDGDGYILKAHRPTFVNGKKVETASLRHADVIRLGTTVELEFRQPSPVSSTARLEIVSRHRMPLAVDGVILMAETCIVGPSAQAHIPAPSLDAPVVLYRQGSALWCRASGEFEVDGQARAGRAPLTLKSNVLGEGFSFSLEPLPAKTGNA
ncbi:MAG: hypothetical protein JWN86_2168 [Planctomycetota bacterium]|nr:hypothetical protein [Planctomycetota bacterium]